MSILIRSIPGQRTREPQDGQWPGNSFAAYTVG